MEQAPDYLKIVGLMDTLSKTGKLVMERPGLQKRLSDLGKDGTDNFAISAVLGGWSRDADAKNQEAINALVLTAGLMYRPTLDIIQDQDARLFLAARTADILLSLDKPNNGTVGNHYGADALRDLIVPAVLWGHGLDEEHKAQFVETMGRYPVDNHPYYTLKGHVGLKGRWLERFTHLKTWVNDSPVGHAISRLVNSLGQQT